MTNKKKSALLGFTATALLATTMGVVFASNGGAASTFAGSTSTWRHYDAVAATLTSNGSKEYWTNCAGVTQLTAPEEETVTEAGAPSAEFVAGLATDDARYVKPLSEGWDFNNGVIPSVMSFSHSGDGEQEIVDGAGPDGSKALKVHTHSSSKVYINADTLSAMFASAGDPDAILFDIKLDRDEYSNHNYFYYESASNQYGVINYNSNTGGLTSGWQTYYFPKSALSDLKENGSIIRIDLSGNWIYLDNIRPGKATSRETGCNFDKGFISSNAVYEGLYNSETHTWDNQEFFKVTTETDIGLEVTPESAPGTVSQGTKSLHVKTGSDGNLMTWINSALYNAIPDDGSLKFDIYSADSDDAAIFNMLEDWQVAQRWKAFDYTRKGKWITVTVPKASIKADRLELFRTQNPGGAIDFYIDNIRIA